MSVATVGAPGVGAARPVETGRAEPLEGKKLAALGFSCGLVIAALGRPPTAGAAGATGAEPDWEVGLAEPDLEVGLAEPDLEVGLAEPDLEVGLAEPNWEVGLAEPDWEVGLAEPDWEVGLAEPDWGVGLAEPDWEVGLAPEWPEVGPRRRQRPVEWGQQLRQRLPLAKQGQESSRHWEGLEQGQQRRGPPVRRREGTGPGRSMSLDMLAGGREGQENSQKLNELQGKEWNQKKA